MSVSAYDHDHGYLAAGGGAAPGAAAGASAPPTSQRPNGVAPPPQRTVVVQRTMMGGQAAPMQYARPGGGRPLTIIGGQNAHHQQTLQSQHQGQQQASPAHHQQRPVYVSAAPNMIQHQGLHSTPSASPIPSQQRIVLPGGAVYVQSRQPVQQHQQQQNPQYHHQRTHPQYAHHHHQQQHHHSLAMSNNNNSLNLAVPMREDSPEPVMIIEPEVKEEPASTSQEIEEEPEGEIDIQIRNVVCNYALPLHIDLRKLALRSNNVTFDRGRGVLLKQKRKPSCYVKIYSSGKVYIVGCKSEVDCMRAARNVARRVQIAMDKVKETVKMRNYKVCNVLATCRMPFGIKIEELAQKYPSQSQYEPELSVGLVWRQTEPKATLRIHTTGSITVTGAQSEAAVMQAIEIIYPIVRQFRCSMRHRAETKKKKTRKRAAPAISRGPAPKRGAAGVSGAVGNKIYFSDEDDIYDEDDLLDEDE